MMSDQVEIINRPITVIRIINEYKVVINRGSEDGVMLGQKYIIYTIDEDIFDLTTGENLGKLEIVKGRGRISHVQEKMSQIESIETKSKKSRSGNALLSLYASVSEQVEDAPFDNVRIGDVCRPI